MVSKVVSHNRFSLSVRMKRSAQPLPSGARTKAGELSMSRKASSCWKASDMYWLPWSCGTEPAPDPLSKAVEVAPHPLPDWFQRLEAGGPACGVDADALCCAVIDRDERYARKLETASLRRAHTRT